jgi:gas vesicle protein
LPKQRQLCSKTKASAFGNCTVARTGEQTVAKQPKGELVVIGFNYDQLETKLADKVRSAADRIRERIKRTVEDIVEVGHDLLAVKETLPHGQFLPWLKAEFGWSERSAQNFMSVAEQFKSAKIADLPIQPSAAYLLAAPSVPDEAREKAVEKAEAGEEITFATAKEIVAEARKKKRPRRQKTISADKLAGRLVAVLERYRDRWETKELAELARQLREFADSLDSQKGGKKAKKE